MEALRRLLLSIVLLSVFCFSQVNAANNLDEELKEEIFISDLHESIEEVKRNSSDPIAVRIPNSLIIGIATLETGYGTSYKARKKLNYFGLKSGGEKYASFSNMNESVECFLKNLSQKEYYYKFQLAIKNGERNPHKLLSLIDEIYSNNSIDYAKKIKSIIKRYDLQKYDQNS